MMVKKKQILWIGQSNEKAVLLKRKKNHNLEHNPHAKGEEEA